MRFILIIFVLFTPKVFSQSLTTDVRENKNIYLAALNEYCKFPEISDSKTIYVQFDSTVMWFDWPKKINNIEVNYLDGSEEILKKIKANNGSIILVKIVPLQYKKEKFFVSVIPFIATKSGKDINLGNGGGLNVIFKFNEELKGFEFVETKSYGN